MFSKHARNLQKHAYFAVVVSRVFERVAEDDKEGDEDEDEEGDEEVEGQAR
jgi:hypothetical protein